jgi:hypothetical protein
MFSTSLGQAGMVHLVFSGDRVHPHSPIYYVVEYMEFGFHLRKIPIEMFEQV